MLLQVGAWFLLTVWSWPLLAQGPAEPGSIPPPSDASESGLQPAEDRGYAITDPPRTEDDPGDSSGESPAPGEDERAEESVDEAENLLGPEDEDFLHLEEIDTSDVSPFSFNGVVDLTYLHFESDENLEGFDEDQILAFRPTLLFKYAFLEQFNALLEVEWDGPEEKLELEQFYLEWLPLDDLLKVGIGRRVLPFGVFRFYRSPARSDLVDDPAVFSAVYPGANADLGMFVRGEYEAEEFSIGYEASVSSGLHGPNRSGAWGDFTDNNDSLWFTGRLSFAPAENLTLGVSYSGGQYDREDKLLADFTGVDVQYRVAGFRLRGEWVGGLVERSGSAGGNYYRRGWYAELMRPWPLPWQYLREVQTVFRFDDIDANNKVRDEQDLRRYCFGLNFVLTEHLRWKFQYEINDERYDEIANDGFLTQIELHW